MADPVTELLRSLSAAKGDPHAQAALAAEFAVAARPEEERAAMRASLDAAAVLRWFDDRLLALVLDMRQTDPQPQFEQLKSLPFVEQYRGRGQDLHNIHEATRLGWRKRLAQNTPERFRTLSMNAAACFVTDPTALGRVEWIYHLLSADPDGGATELQRIARDWSRLAGVEDRSVLAAALKELEATSLLTGSTRAWALLVIASTRAGRGEEAQLTSMVLAALKEARDAKDARAEARSRSLLGDVYHVQGRLKKAQREYQQLLEIVVDLASREPSDTNNQSALAEAHNRLGIILDAQGKAADAQAEFKESLAIAKALADSDPRNVVWQSDLGGAYNWLGSVLEGQKKLTEAQEAYSECLTISQNLAAGDPDNARLQTGLAAAHSRMGSILEALGRRNEAQKEHEMDVAIACRLAQADPSHPRWQSNLAQAYANLGNILEAQGENDEARVKFGEALSISQHLVDLDPNNAPWHRDLAVIYARLAALESKEGNDETALPFYEEANRILIALTEDAPGFTDFEEVKTYVETQLSMCRESIERAAKKRDPSSGPPAVSS